MFLNSIRWRLQLWHGLLLVLVLVGFGVTAYQLQRANHLKRLDQQLQLRIELVGNLMHQSGLGRPRPRDFEREGPSEDGLPPPRRDRPPPGKKRPPLGDNPDFVPPDAPEPPELRLSVNDSSLFADSSGNAFYYVVWTREGRLISRSDSAPKEVQWPGRGSGANITRMRGTFREMFHHTPPGECILVGKDIGSELAEVGRTGGLLLAAGGAVLALGLAGGAWLATRAIRPIKDISATAMKISNGDLAQRIPAADTDNELGQLAAVLNSTFARLEAAFAQQAQFTSDAAHELRTPISVLLTQIQSVLTRERTSQEYRETLEACQRATQRMRRLVESLLELARLDAGEQTMKRTRFDLAQAANDCIELVKPLAAERRITIEADAEPAHCLGDPEQLSQVITNVLTNAIHYNYDGGKVRVESKQQNGSAIITIADQGQGIAAEDLPHIFERFWRGDKSRSRANGRTGLGLAISKSIIDAHNGSVDVVSELGKGTTFTIRLPQTA